MDFVQALHASSPLTSSPLAVPHIHAHPAVIAIARPTNTRQAPHEGATETAVAPSCKPPCDSSIASQPNLRVTHNDHAQPQCMPGAASVHHPLEGMGQVHEASSFLKWHQGHAAGHLPSSGALGDHVQENAAQQLPMGYGDNDEESCPADVKPSTGDSSPVVAKPLADTSLDQTSRGALHDNHSVGHAGVCGRPSHVCGAGGGGQRGSKRAGVGMADTLKRIRMCG